MSIKVGPFDQNRDAMIMEGLRRVAPMKVSDTRSCTQVLADRDEARKRIAELEESNAAHTDDPRATDPIGPNDEAHRSVEETIGHIVNGRVIPSARAKVRAALDKADAPPTGRAARDAALGRALR